jgi:hypothetical protein
MALRRPAPEYRAGSLARGQLPGLDDAHPLLVASPGRLQLIAATVDELPALARGREQVVQVHARAPGLRVTGRAPLA